MTRAPKGGPAVVQWTTRARRDLEEIWDYIAADDPVAADRWVERLSTRALGAARTPMAGRMLPERPRADLREVLLRTCRIVYRVHAEGILVLTVIEGHRRLPRLAPGGAERG
jgi:plasmid stabilization system protein ParE